LTKSKPSDSFKDYLPNDYSTTLSDLYALRQTQEARKKDNPLYNTTNSKLDQTSFDRYMSKYRQPSIQIDIVKSQKIVPSTFITKLKNEFTVNSPFKIAE
jgi:hypothetical protein